MNRTVFLEWIFSNTGKLRGSGATEKIENRNGNRIMRNIIIMGGFGIGYLSLRRAFRRRPVFSGRVSERTDLIAWNETLMECIEQLLRIASDDEIVSLLDNITRIRDVSMSVQRGSLNELQRLLSSTSLQFTRVAGRARGGMTLEQIRIQNSLIEDVSPVIYEIFESIQHNHMLDTLGP